MKAGKAIIDCLEQILYREGYSHLVLKKCLTGNFTEQEKARIKWAVWEIIRKQSFLDLMICEFLDKRAKLDKYDRLLFLLGFLELVFSGRPDYSIVDNCVKLARKNRGFINGVLRNAGRQRQRLIELKEHYLEMEYEKNIKSVCILHSIDENLKDIFKNTFLDEGQFAEFITFADNETKLSIRINTLRISVEDYCCLLSGQNISYERCAGLPAGLKVDCPFNSLPGYEKGLFSVQSESSQFAGIMDNVFPGSKIVDYCSFPGGKTGFLAETYPDTEITAVNITSEKLQATRNEMNRLGHQRVVHQILSNQWLEENKGSFDFVLADVPCSGLGNFSSKPEIRFRTDSKKIDELVSLQKKILEETSNLLKKGGVLIYSACTVIYEETIGQIKDFLGSCGEFVLIEDSLRIPGRENFYDEGFYKAVLRRK